MLDFKPKEIAILAALFVLMLACFWFAADNFARAVSLLAD